MASDVHKNTDTKVETVSANSVCRQLPQKTAEQGLAAAVAFAEEVQWSLAIRRTISGVGFGEALKLLMNDRDMTVEQMESESGLSVSTVKRLRAGQDASVEQIVAISVALHLPPPVSGDLLRMCGITLDFNNQKNTVYQMILTEYYKEGIEQVNVCLEACGSGAAPWLRAGRYPPCGRGAKQHRKLLFAQPHCCACYIQYCKEARSPSPRSCGR